MVGMFETPSRILRRIEAIEGREMPSLPSLPSFENSAEESNDQRSDSEDGLDLSALSSPIHSTPAASTHHTVASTIHPGSSTSSTARFAASLAASRSTKSLGLSSSSRRSLTKDAQYDSFEISNIPSLPNIQRSHISGNHSNRADEVDEHESAESVPDEHLPPPGEGYDDEAEVEDMSLADALQSVSRGGTPPPQPLDAFEDDGTPKKGYDYSVSLKSEPKVSPFDKYRNIAFRRTINRMRTPSLSRTTPSPATSPANSTPRSNRSIALSQSNAASPISSISLTIPQSANASPAVIPLPRSRTGSPTALLQRSQRSSTSPGRELSNVTQETDIRSMDITDVHSVPPRIDDQRTDEGSESEADRLDEGYNYHPEGASTEGPRRTSSDGGAPSFYFDGQHGMDLGDQHEPTLPSDSDVAPYAQNSPSGSPPEMRHSTSNDHSEDPTFSTDEGPTPFAQRRASPHNSSSKNSSNASSVADASTAFTPTPAFPRPRARFNLPPPPQELLATPAPQEGLGEEQGPVVNDLMTPHSRRRSFLLSVINSTARPRFKVPTPHPRNIPSTPSVIESTPGTNVSSAVRTNTYTPFAGVTPRPRLPANRRQSHPLSQTVAPSPAASDSESTGVQTAEPWTASAPLSPYDGAVDKVSFISTASSHDLTTHHRMNTSFDPAMGFGAGGQGVGRFDAIKLNNYLHGLNRKLEEENQALVERLRKYETVEDARSFDDGQISDRRLSGASRRLSGGMALGNVQEDQAEEWLEEKAELEEMVETFKDELAQVMNEKAEIEQELENEQEERSRDKERFQERMTEMQESVTQLVQKMEKDAIAAERRAEKAEEKLTQAEAATAKRMKEIERELAKLEAEKDAALERAGKAEEALESKRDLGGDLTDANNRISELSGDLRNANSQIHDLEDELMQMDHRIDELEQALKNERSVIAGLETDIEANADALAGERANVHNLEDDVSRLEGELQAARDCIEELEQSAEGDAEQCEHLKNTLKAKESEISRSASSLDETQRRVVELEDQLQNANEMRRQVEEALDAAEEKMAEDADTIADLEAKLTSAERERDRILERSVSKSLSRNPLEDAPTVEELEALECELDDANREIARLKTLLNQSPARQAMDKAKDTKIDMLEKEKEELVERNRALRMTITEVNTPAKIINTSGISPIHRHVLALSVRVPRTPGGPLRELSWLQNTASDPSASPFVAEIHRLQRELDRANDSIDDKLDKLEDAGLGVVGLTKKLDQARSKIIDLEEEIARLIRREERRLRYLERARCQKCHIKVELPLLQADSSSLQISNDSLPTEPPTPPTRTSEALRNEVASVTSRLTSLQKEWEEEKRQLLGEKAVLQDATNRLNSQVKLAKDEARKITESERASEKARTTVQNDLERAKSTIVELESDLKAERSRLRVLSVDQERALREKEEILMQVQRTENDMDDVRQQLTRLKHENKDLEKELRENANAEQKARLLETRVSENLDTIEQLRHERSLLVSEHKQLQQKYSQISENANKLRDELATHSTSHDNHRHQLDLRLLELEDLRRALGDRAEELERVEAEKNRISAEKKDVSKMISGLEADLRRVRKDAEAFGRDLKLLRAEKEKLEVKHQEEMAKAERTKKQTQAQIRVLNEQLESQKQKAVKTKEEFDSHVCAAGDRQLTSMRLQHNKECKGLIVQIRYLKAKYVRESAFRSDLGYQKQYLLVLLSQFEKSERTIIASIARIGFPILPTSTVKKPPLKMKSVVRMVIFLRRIRQASNHWREQSASKQAIAAALNDVRRRREAPERV